MRAPRLVPHLEDDPDEWHPWWDNAPRLRPSPSTRLSAIRHAFYEEVLAARAEQGRQVRVTTYVLEAPGVDADSTHRALAEHAERMGWRLGTQRFTDEPAGGPADARSAFNEACRYAAAGFVDGILAPDRATLTPSDEAYESYLRWLHDRLSFIAYAPTAAPPTSELRRSHRPAEPGDRLPRAGGRAGTA